ncbi:MAG: cation transporter [Bacteroidota bacterium]|nr:cation transporter [Bacteroidota bacterium]MDP4233182.1 cation transporter [Bacteroidota bacterium]MDP4242199.1 cation transporter [Bacteroidota bacterium]MDP4289403.1 cation transporter [Bacteroidota bacterium]
MTKRNPLASAIRIEQITIGWMVVEAVASIASGIAVCSTALVAFGADSFIELISAAILLWRLILERRHGSEEQVNHAERIAAWVSAYALLALCVYIIVESIYGLVNARAMETSAIGIAVSIAAVVGMPLLSVKKKTLAKELNSSALRADAACSLTCGYMAGALLAGLAANAVTGWWWVDSVVSLAFLFWLIPEAIEALTAAKRGHIGCGCGDRDLTVCSPTSINHV